MADNRQSPEPRRDLAVLVEVVLRVVGFIMSESPCRRSVLSQSVPNPDHHRLTLKPSLREGA